MGNKLTFSTVKIIDDSKLFGGVNYEISINPDTDLEIGIAASAQITFTTNNTDIMVGQEFTYEEINDNTTTTVGKFIIDSIDIDTSGRYMVTAYDYISKFDKKIDGWWNGLTFPITVGSIFSSLCSFCGVTPQTTVFTNSTMSIPTKPMEMQNIQGRAILAYIAEVAGGIAMALPSGNITIKQYTYTQTISNGHYVSIKASEQQPLAINRVCARMDENDIGISYPTTISSNDNPLYITYNPFLFTNGSRDITTYLQAIYNVVSQYLYTPMNIELLEDFGINVGDIIGVDLYTTFIMSKSKNASGVSLSSTGNKDRTSAVEPTSETRALIGRYNRVVDTVDEHTREIGSLETGFTRVEQTANSAIITAQNAEGTAGQALEIAQNAVTFTDLETQGQTIINGANITTGTIDASRVRLTGNLYRLNSTDSGSESTALLVGININDRLQIGSATNNSTYEGSSFYTNGDLYIMTGGESQVSYANAGLYLNSSTHKGYIYGTEIGSGTAKFK